MSLGKRHAWETEAPPAGRQRASSAGAALGHRHEWEVDTDAAAAEDEGVDEAENDEPAEKLQSLMCHLLFNNKLSALDFCILSYWITQGKGRGVEDFALAPGKQTGKYQDKLDRLWGSRKEAEGHYKSKLAMTIKHDTTRDLHTFPMVPPHELLHPPGASATARRQAQRKSVALIFALIFALMLGPVG